VALTYVFIIEILSIKKKQLKTYLYNFVYPPYLPGVAVHLDTHYLYMQLEILRFTNPVVLMCH